MDMPASGGISRQAGRREWTGLAVLALPTLLLSIDMSVLYLALPRLSTSLHANSVQQLWVIDIYSFMTAGFLVTMGSLGDRIGRRRLMMIGAAVFGAASVVAAYSTSPGMLIACRAAMGIAGATLLPSALGILRTMFPDPKQMARAMSVWYSCFLGGQAVGPLVGGLLLQHFWWGSVFLLGVPVMVALLVCAPVLLPEAKHTANGRLDLTSVVLSLAAVLPIIYGLKDAANNGWSAVALATLLTGAVFAVVFVARQRRLSSPLLDLSLFRSVRFSTSLSVMLVSGVVMSGIVLLTAIYLQTVRGYSPIEAGLLLLPQNIAMVIGSLTAPMLLAKLRSSYVMAGGLAVSALGMLLVALVHAASPTPLLVVGLTLTLGGVSFPMVVVGNLIMSSAPVEKSGAAAGLMETSGEFGVAVGVAVMGSIGAAVYRTTLPDFAGVPNAVVHTSVTQAATTAARLPADLGRELMAAARPAFTDGFDVVAGIGAGVFVVLAVVCVLAFGKGDRRESAGPQGEAAAVVPVPAGTEPDAIR